MRINPSPIHEARVSIEKMNPKAPESLPQASQGTLMALRPCSQIIVKAGGSPFNREIARD